MCILENSDNIFLRLVVCCGGDIHHKGYTKCCTECGLNYTTFDNKDITPYECHVCREHIILYGSLYEYTLNKYNKKIPKCLPDIKIHSENVLFINCEYDKRMFIQSTERSRQIFMNE